MSELYPFRARRQFGWAFGDPSQQWFWTEEWQRGEADAEEDIAAGRVRHFESVDAAVAWLIEEPTDG